MVLSITVVAGAQAGAPAGAPAQAAPAPTAGQKPAPPLQIARIWGSKTKADPFPQVNPKFFFTANEPSRWTPSMHF